MAITGAIRPLDDVDWAILTDAEARLLRWERFAVWLAQIAHLGSLWGSDERRRQMFGQMTTF